VRKTQKKESCARGSELGAFRESFCYLNNAI
jgi:hypothetical protein